MGNADLRTGRGIVDVEGVDQLEKRDSLFHEKGLSIKHETSWREFGVMPGNNVAGVETRSDMTIVPIRRTIPRVLASPEDSFA